MDILVHVLHYGRSDVFKFLANCPGAPIEQRVLVGAKLYSLGELCVKQDLWNKLEILLDAGLNADRKTKRAKHVYTLHEFIRTSGSDELAVKFADYIQGQQRKKRRVTLPDVHSVLESAVHLFPPDFTILAGPNKTPIHVHLSVLKERSPYFQGLFSSAMSESTSKRVTIPDFDARAVSWVIHCLYKGTIVRIEEPEGDIHGDTREAQSYKPWGLLLLKTAAYFQVAFVVEMLAYEIAMSGSLDADSMLYYWDFSRSFPCTALARACVEYFRDEQPAIVNSKSAEEMEADTLLSLLRASFPAEAAESVQSN
jgi:hypothetical protein